MAVISDSNIVKSKFLLPGEMVSLLTSLASLPIIAIFFWQRFTQARRKTFTIASCVLLFTYVVSFFYTLALTTIIHIRFESQYLCDSTILLCLTLYVASKVAALTFLIERAYIISWPIAPRHKSPEYVWSCICIFAPYIVVSGLSINYRTAFVNDADICIIGIKMYALIPLMLVEVLSYLYLTIRFLVPLIAVHFSGDGLLLPLRGVVKRTCIGTGITTMSTLATKISLTMFNGEPAWLCCMTCKLDALIACSILYWITISETQDETEHDAPHALGTTCDLDSATGVAASQNSGSFQNPSHSPSSGLQESLRKCSVTVNVR